MDPRSRTNSRRRLRAKLIMSGFTYRSFAEKVGVSEHTVRAAILGQRRGKKAMQVVTAIQELSHAA